MNAHRRREPLSALVEHGMLLQSARGPVPNAVEAIIGEPVRGSWWGHPRSHEIFAALNELAASPDVVRTRLVNGKVTLVHRRVWPALVRVADQLPPGALCVLHEEHTASGKHRTTEEAFPSWVPAAVMTAAAAMSVEEAWAQLPAFLRPTG